MRHQFAFAWHVVPEEKEDQLEDHDRIDPDVAVTPVTRRHLLPHEDEVHQLPDTPQRMIVPDALFQIDPVAEQLHLLHMLAHPIQELTY